MEEMLAKKQNYSWRNTHIATITCCDINWCLAVVWSYGLQEASVCL